MSIPLDIHRRRGLRRTCLNPRLLPLPCSLPLVSRGTEAPGSLDPAPERQPGPEPARVTDALRQRRNWSRLPKPFAGVPAVAAPGARREWYQPGRVTAERGDRPLEATTAVGGPTDRCRRSTTNVGIRPQAACCLLDSPAPGGILVLTREQSPSSTDSPLDSLSSQHSQLLEAHIRCDCGDSRA